LAFYCAKRCATPIASYDDVCRWRTIHCELGSVLPPRFRGESMDSLITIFLPLALAIIMFSLGLGLTLDDFRRVAARPKTFAIGAGAQLILIPAVAYILVLLFRLPPELAVGMMILAL